FGQCVAVPGTPLLPLVRARGGVRVERGGQLAVVRRAGAQRPEHEVLSGVDRVAYPRPALQGEGSQLLPGGRVLDVRRAVGGGTAGAVQLGDGGGDEVVRVVGRPAGERDGPVVRRGEQHRQSDGQQRHHDQRDDELLDQVVRPGGGRRPHGTRGPRQGVAQ